MKKKVIILVISIIVVLIILSTTTYALFFRKDKLENTESYTAGILDIVIENDEEGLGETLNLTNSLPITDEEGKKSNPYKFKITNKGNLSYTFDLSLNNTTTNNQINEILQPLVMMMEVARMVVQELEVVEKLLLQV